MFNLTPMRKYIFISILATAATLLFPALSYKNIKENGDTRTLFSHLIQPKSGSIPILPPPMEALGQGAHLPTAQELEQEKQFNAQQVELAGQWLKSPYTHQQIKRAEQLGAYESPLSEQCLVGALRHDAVSEVRKAAAQSLSALKYLSDSAISTLLKTLSDTNAGIRIATLVCVLKSVCFKSLIPSRGKPDQYPINHRDMNKCFAGFKAFFVIFAQTAIVIKPCKRALNNPPMRQ
ncbi:MAG: HEAT repeat domain-containing protein [Methylococcales bacterium]|nr:HEAT repeat domain-containing protein [Methylococcales bacterium]